METVTLTKLRLVWGLEALDRLASRKLAALEQLQEPRKKYH